MYASLIASTDLWPQETFTFWKCFQWWCLKAVSVPSFVLGGLRGFTATSGLVDIQYFSLFCLISFNRKLSSWWSLLSEMSKNTVYQSCQCSISFLPDLKMEDDFTQPGSTSAHDIQMKEPGIETVKFPILKFKKHSHTLKCAVRIIRQECMQRFMYRMCIVERQRHKKHPEKRWSDFIRLEERTKSTIPQPSRVVGVPTYSGFGFKPSKIHHNGYIPMLLNS